MKDLPLSELELLYRVLVENAPKYFNHSENGDLVDNFDIDHLRLLLKSIDELLKHVQLPF